MDQSKDPKPPPQKQGHQPGRENRMEPVPQSQPQAPTSGRLKGKVALITGGDSGIGRAVAVLYAAEGADVAIAYLDEHDDAQETRRMVEARHRHCLLIPGDLGEEKNCTAAVEKTVERFGRIDILVNNAAMQFPKESIEEITEEQLLRTFRSNIFSYFFVTKHAVPHIPAGGAIINTSSVTAYRGSETLLDYSSTKGAIVSFTRSLSKALVKRDIRVNGVAPGPVWTPLIPSTFTEERVEKFGKNVPMERAAQPSEIAPSYVFLACADSTYITGQFLHPNGGDAVES